MNTVRPPAGTTGADARLNAAPGHWAALLNLQAGDTKREAGIHRPTGAWGNQQPMFAGHFNSQGVCFFVCLLCVSFCFMPLLSLQCSHGAKSLEDYYGLPGPEVTLCMQEINKPTKPGVPLTIHSWGSVQRL